MTGEVIPGGNPVADWLRKNHVDTSPREGRYAFTSISSSVDHARECLAWIVETERARTPGERAVAQAHARDAALRAKDTIEHSRRREQLMYLNANREGKRGRVYTLGAIASDRFATFHLPEIVLREDTPPVTADIVARATRAYWHGMPVAPVAPLDAQLSISIHVGKSLAQVLGEAADDLSVIERTLFKETYDITHALARDLLSGAPLRGRMETEEKFRESLALLASHAGTDVARGSAAECAAAIATLSRDETWPFVDPTLRNFCIDVPLAAYRGGNGTIRHCDPDRYGVAASRSVTLVHLLFQAWRTIPLADLFATLPGHEPAALYYLTRRVAKAIAYGPPRSHATHPRIEDALAEHERACLHELLAQGTVREAYPHITDSVKRALTRAARASIP